jgi:hypothetical protein
MAFSTSLSAWTDETKNELIAGAIQGADTLSRGLINTMSGVKSTSKLNLLSVTGEFQSDTGCSYNTSGTTAFTQRTLTVADIAIMETFCPKDLEGYWTEYALKAGGANDVMPFEQMITGEINKVINRNLDMAIWQSKTSYTFATAFKHFAGLIDIIDTAGTAISGNTSSETSITTSNAITIMDNIYAAIPAALQGSPDLVTVMGMDNFVKLKIALKNANYYHYDATTAANELVLPWSGLKVYGLNGLNATNHGSLPTAVKNRIFTYEKKNLFFGTDLLGEENNYDIWYSKDDRNIKTLVTFKAGTQVAYPAEVVQYTNA